MKKGPYNSTKQGVGIAKSDHWRAAVKDPQHAEAVMLHYLELEMDYRLGCTSVRREYDIRPIIGCEICLIGEDAASTINVYAIGSIRVALERMEGRVVGSCAEEIVVGIVKGRTRMIGRNIRCVRRDGDRRGESQHLPTAAGFTRECAGCQQCTSRGPQGTGVGSRIPGHFVETNSSYGPSDVQTELDTQFHRTRT